MPLQRILRFAALAAVLLALSAPAFSQTVPESPRADKQTTNTVDGSASYLATAGSALTGAFDRAIKELDAFPLETTPADVKDATFRRRLLELRLLMDLEAYAYDPVLLHTFRKVVDDSYEEVGDFQDVTVTEKILDAKVPAEIVKTRLIKMNVTLASLRTPAVRSAMRTFLASPSTSLRALSPGDTPRLWSLAGITPSAQLDGCANAARLATAVFQKLESGDIFVADIFDRPQEIQFHATRKDIRSTLLILLMFTPTREATRGVSESLWGLVSNYGDVNDSVVAWRTAMSVRGPVDAGAKAVRTAFAAAKKQEQSVLDGHAFDAMGAALKGVTR